MCTLYLPKSLAIAQVNLNAYHTKARKTNNQASFCCCILKANMEV